MTIDEIKFLEKTRDKMMERLLLEGYSLEELSIIFNKHVNDIEKIMRK